MKTLKNITLLVLICATNTYACTIFCGKDKFGNVWAANNEDGAYSFKRIPIRLFN